LKFLNVKNGYHETATIGLPPVQFMLRQEAGRGQGKRERWRSKGNSPRAEDAEVAIKKRIAAIQAGGIPAILTGVHLSMDAAA
jgi:hypothetical protein